MLWFGFGLVACIRIGALGLGWENLRSDPDAYRALAASWHDTGTLGRIGSDGAAVPTAYRPPLYPWLLSWFSSASPGIDDRWWIALLHAVLGVATCVLTYAIGRRLRMSHAGCSLAVFWVACDPILLRQSTLVMTETTATFLGALAWWLGLRSDEPARPDRWTMETWLLGVSMGIAALCRPTALAWIVLWWGSGLAMQRWRWVIGCGLGVLVAIAPWTIRNAMQFGVPIATTTHGGYTLYLANNPTLYAHWRSSVSREWDEDAFHDRWRQERSQAQTRDEVSLDHLAQSLAWSTIAGDPSTAVRACAIRAGWLWALWPSHRQSSRWAQLAIACWYAIGFVLAGIGCARVLRSGSARWLWLPGLLLVVSLTMVHSVYWSNMRMRAPAVPVLGLLAGAGIVRRWDPGTETGKP